MHGDVSTVFGQETVVGLGEVLLEVELHASGNIIETSVDPQVLEDGDVNISTQSDA